MSSADLHTPIHKLAFCHLMVACAKSLMNDILLAMQCFRDAHHILLQMPEQIQQDLLDSTNDKSRIVLSHCLALAITIMALTCCTTRVYTNRKNVNVDLRDVWRP